MIRRAAPNSPPLDALIAMAYQSPVSIGQFSVRLVDNRAVGGGYFCLEFESDADNPVAEARPGQFVMLRAEAWGRDLINGRPFSVMEVLSKRRFSILGKAFGRGTAHMAASRPGERYTCTGALGRPFELDPGASRAICIAGGVGLPPMLYWARALAERGDSGLEIELFYGGRSRDDLVLLDELRATGAALTLATDDGSHGVAGRITVPLVERLRALESARERSSTRLFACGPTPMLQAVRTLGLERNITTYLCLEEQMACGFGVCLGCAVPVHGERPFAYCCTDGPVFEARELRWS